MKNRRYFFVLMLPLILGLFAGLLMLLWNTLLPSIFQLPALTYWQAVGLLVLCRILFGGFGFGRRGYAPSPFAGSAARYRKRWMQMSEEEKQQLREEWKKRCRKPEK